MTDNEVKTVKVSQQELEQEELGEINLTIHQKGWFKIQKLFRREAKSMETKILSGQERDLFELGKLHGRKEAYADCVNLPYDEVQNRREK